MTSEIGYFSSRFSFCYKHGPTVSVPATAPTTVRQILEHVGEPTIAPAIAPARSPPLEMKIWQELAAPEAVFEAIPEVEFDQTVWTAGEVVQEHV